MKKTVYSPIEQEMIDFDFESITTEVADAKASLTSRIDLAGGLDNLCAIWQKIGRFIELLVNVPVIGKYVSILVELLDSICQIKP